MEGRSRLNKLGKNNLIYGIGIYHIQTKLDPLSLLNIQPFKGKSQVGSHPSHFTGLPAPFLAPPPAMMFICCFQQTSRVLTVRNVCVWVGEKWRGKNTRASIFLNVFFFSCS